MDSDKKYILTINGGSSSIKFALYEKGESLTPLFAGELESIGSKNALLNFHNIKTNQKNTVAVQAGTHGEAANFVIELLNKQAGFGGVIAIGHRIVLGMNHSAPEIITNDLLTDLKRISAYDPEHLPGEIQLIEVFKQRFPGLNQVACFDTAFHTSMPQVAKMLPLPRRFFDKGIQRYGFHGLSYAFLLDELQRTVGNEVAQGKLILAHLGSGASLAAVKEGKSLDTSMGFTPTAGIPMGTRTGDLDPGVALYLMRNEKMHASQFATLINHESGLLGISETNSDMRKLLEIESNDPRAAEAIEFFCYQTRKWIGSFIAVLGGLDTLVFTAGIGENAPEIRKRICNGLQFTGVELDEQKNASNETIISTDASKVTVRVIRTNEELMIARLVEEVVTPRKGFPHPFGVESAG